MKLTESELFSHAWQYFKLHSSQRISVFNFYIILISIMITGLVSTFQASFDAHLIGVTLGLLIALISFIFWKLDTRTKQLVKISERALKYFEKHMFGDKVSDKPHPSQIFLSEEELTGPRKLSKYHSILNAHMSYTTCFNFVFLLFGFSGLFGAIFSMFVH